MISAGSGVRRGCPGLSGPRPPSPAGEMDSGRECGSLDEVVGYGPWIGVLYLRDALVGELYTLSRN